MAFQVRDAGTLRTMSEAFVRQAGIQRRLRQAFVQDGGSLRLVATFAPPLSVTATPALVSGAQSASSDVLITSTQTTAVPTGGLAPYTYAYTFASGDSINASTPSSASTIFSATVPQDQSFLATFTVTVTDAAGQTASDTVSVSLRNAGTGDDVA